MKLNTPQSFYELIRSKLKNQDSLNFEEELLIVTNKYFPHELSFYDSYKEIEKENSEEHGIIRTLRKHYTPLSFSIEFNSKSLFDIILNHCNINFNTIHVEPALFHAIKSSNRYYLSRLLAKEQTNHLLKDKNQYNFIENALYSRLNQDNIDATKTNHDRYWNIKNYHLYQIGSALKKIKRKNVNFIDYFNKNIIHEFLEQKEYRTLILEAFSKDELFFFADTFTTEKAQPFYKELIKTENINLLKKFIEGTQISSIEMLDGSHRSFMYFIVDKCMELGRNNNMTLIKYMFELNMHKNNDEQNIYHALEKIVSASLAQTIKKEQFQKELEHELIPKRDMKKIKI